MNNIFNLGRLNAVLTKEIRESWQTLLLTWGSMVGILTIVSLLIAYFNQGANQEWFDGIVQDSVGQTIAICVYLFSAIAACSVFRLMRNKALRLQALMLPASQLEKFAAAWIIAVPLFFIFFIVAVFISQLLTAGLFRLIGSADISYPIINWLSNDDEFLGINNSGSSIMALLFIQSFFLLGGIVWSKNPLIKTFASLFAIGLVYMLCCGWVEALTIRAGQFDIINPHFNIDFIDNAIITVFVVMTIFNYSLTYLRLREAEIINRW